MANNDEAGEILIERAKDNDLDAFNHLVLRFQNAIFNHCLRLMADEASAADITQDVFIRAYRSLRAYRGGNFKAWLMRIATNLCYDELRRIKRRPQVYLEDLRGEDTTIGTEIPASDESPEESVLRTELARAIQHCISRLNPAQRIVLVLCDVQGYSYQETADIADTQEVPRLTTESVQTRPDGRVFLVLGLALLATSAMIRRRRRG